VGHATGTGQMLRGDRGGVGMAALDRPLQERSMPVLSGQTTRRFPKSRLAVESACSTANNQPPSVTCPSTTTGQGQVRHDRSWNEHSFHDLAGHVLRISRSDGCAARDSNPEPVD
jgi:hypothetical protein